MVTVAGQSNTVGQPIFLLPLNTANQLCVTETTGGGTLTIPEAPGFSLTFGPGQVTFPGGSKTGCVSVTVVHGDKVPMAPGFGQQPRFIVTIQPAGALFNPPAPITLPNVDGLRAARGDRDVLVRSRHRLVRGDRHGRRQRRRAGRFGRARASAC